MNDLSVIIPVYHSPGKLKKTLAALLAQSEEIREIIVVIDSEEDKESLSVANAFASEKITTLIQPNKGRAGARNKGTESASGDLLLFLDADMICEPFFIRKHLEFHQKNAGSILIGSAFRDPAAAEKSFDRYLIGVEKKWRTDMPLHAWISADQFAFTAANMSIPKKIFIEAGGFDRSLRDSEDLDLGIRVLKKNIPVYYDSSVGAAHNDFPTLRSFVKRLRQYKRAKRDLFLLHPEYRDFTGKEKKNRRPPFKKIIFTIAKLFLSPIVFTDGALLRPLPEKWKQ
ncbi:MAG TPA: glycosyltransferase, partial [Bacteroidia bacterium]|nr:glycosyltransferase [Bacteroidia bacterium]